MNTRIPSRWLMAAATCAPLWMGAKECATIVVGEKPGNASGACEYRGKAYASGESFASSDGCNECRCDDGAVGCTLRDCGATCEYAGTIYGEGEEFPADDGCNECSCTEGRVACTDVLCQPGCVVEGKHYAIGETFMNDCAGCACTAEGPVCDLIACAPEEGCALGDTTFPVGSGVMCKDGCNRCECSQSDHGLSWVSTDIGCPSLRQIEVCEGGPGDAEARATPLYLDGDALALRLEFGGGCAEHSFRLCTDGAFRESSPVQVSLWVVDDGEPDPCFALLHEEHVFDLTPLRALHEKSYPSGPSNMTLQLNEGATTYRW